MKYIVKVDGLMRSGHWNGRKTRMAVQFDYLSRKTAYNRQGPSTFFPMAQHFDPLLNGRHLSGRLLFMTHFDHNKRTILIITCQKKVKNPIENYSNC